MRRINVVGTSCAGKSTFAKSIAAALNIPHIELDALHWEPNWVEVSADVFRSRVQTAITQDQWVVDGNYAIARDLVWPMTDTIIWLDYSFATVFIRAIRRTFGRSFKGELCCNGNKESLRRAFSRDSIILWVWKTHADRRKQFTTLIPQLASPQAKIVILKSPRQARRWLEQQLPAL